MTDRSTPPEIHAIEAFPLPTPRRESLQNGIPVFLFDNPNLDLIHLLVQVRTGSFYQPAKHVCNFTYSLLKESSPRFSPQETAEKLDYYGTAVSVNVGLTRVQILISTPKDKLADILPVVADFLISPTFRDENLRIMQDKEVKNLAYNSQKTDYRSWQLMWHEMLGETFPAVSEIATPATINALTTKQLQDFHKGSFCAENVTVFVTGNTDSASERLIADTFSAIPHGTPSPKLPRITTFDKTTNFVYQPMEGCLQSSIILSSISIGYNHPDRTAFSVLNTLTGGYFSSRLMQNLRERQGLTYGISSASTYFGEQSVFAISSDVNASQTAHAIDSCFEELQRLQDEPVSEQELTMVKNYIAGIQLRAADTTVNAMQKYAYFHTFGLDESEMSRYLTDIKKVTPEEILKLSRRYFSYNNFTQIIVGNYLREK